ncbi:hypothetical protein LPW26_06015 [Rhodopseudomonas sp. HC1]|uniref:hypothetical protein n=1 Tax=Rhodopseudomonas infernalis TaxID=2897386 RepID=UPI001EE97B5F|nr:hypothetical protein [Rhodopseudomonas infernalis]MCG6204182.1 hypothetical protein [Rhodopseudomonas infernalis]
MALGLCDRATLVLADGAKRPTVRLNLGASFDIDCEEDRARYDGVFARAGDAQSLAETGDFQSPVETGDDEESERVQNDSNINAVEADNSALAGQSPVGTGNSGAIPRPGTDPFPVLRLQKDSLLDSKTPPLPPSGGERASDPEWEEFVGSWGEPIPKLGLSRSVFDRVETGRRSKLIAAAKGYRTWLCSHPPQKRPTAQSAQSFIRDEAGWDQWLRYVPAADGKVHSATSTYQVGSPEARAINAMYAVARVRPFESGGRIVYRGEMSARVKVFADAPESSAWLWIEDRNQIGAWANFLKDRVLGNRPPLIVARGVGENERRGIRAPWPWPPKADGSIATSERDHGADPPPPEMTADDDEAFASEGGRG